MRRSSEWSQTKFAKDRRGRWRANRRNVRVTSRLVADRAAAAYATAIQSHASGRLADLGCGEVPLFAMYRDLVSDVVCVDWPGSFHDAKHVDIFADLNEPLDLEPNSFDTIIASDVLEHLHAPQQLFDSAAQALGPGGRLIIGVPFLYWIHEAPYDFHRYTSFALEHMTKAAELEVVSISPFGGAPEVLFDIATKTARGFPWLAWTFYSLSRAITPLPVVKWISKVSAEHMPMGYVLVAQKPVR